MSVRSPAILLLLLLLGTAIGSVYAQSQDLYWERLDVELVVETDGNILVSESWVVTFTSGTFRFGSRNIPTARLEGIADVGVWIDGRPVPAGDGARGTFETYREGGDFFIKWHFPEPVGPSTHSYQIDYRVSGGLRIYDGGDQIWWEAVFPDRDFPVRSSKITVRLPPGVDEVQNVASYFHPAEHAVVDPVTVVFNARDIPPGRPLEVRVQFPHGVVQAQPPAWQAADDSARAIQDVAGPVATAAALCLGLLIPVLGLLGIYLLWYTRGRDQPARLPVSYLAEPPSDLRPGVVGTLVDEFSDMKDTVATIVDLARRGVIRMTEIEKPGFLGIGATRDFEFEKVDEPEDLLPYERRILKEMFGSRDRRTLSDLKNKFYEAIPKIQKEMYKEVVSRKLFPRSPHRTRRIYYGLAIAGLVLAGISYVVLAAILKPFTGLYLLPAIGIGLVSAAFLVVARFMPRKTGQGAEEAARWRAFHTYLEEIRDHVDLKQAQDLFDRYLPYAIALGLKEQWIAEFVRADAPAPPWYRPGPGYGWGPGGFSGAGAAGRGGGGGRRGPGRASRPGGGPPSLQQASDGMAASLQSMSDGLTSLLNTTGQTLGSAPSGGSGGGWSGGGGFGGGGGGGGGGGFG